MPDAEEWEAIVRGALIPLSDPGNFEEHGAISPDDTADRFMLMLSDFVSQFDTYPQRLQEIFGSSLLGMWPLWELSGNVANDVSGHCRHGTHSNVTLAQPGIGDGRTMAGYNGTTSYTDIFSHSLVNAFSGAAGTLALWAKVDAAGVWTDGTTKYLSVINAAPTNRLAILKSSTNNQLRFFYIANNVNKTINVTMSPTTLFHAALTWDYAADQLIAYVNGSQVGSTLTGLGAWVGLPAVGFTNIGAGSTAPSSVFAGTLGHVALGNRALSSAEILSLISLN